MSWHVRFTKGRLTQGRGGVPEFVEADVANLRDASCTVQGEVVLSMWFWVVVCPGREATWVTDPLGALHKPGLGVEVGHLTWVCKSDWACWGVETSVLRWCCRWVYSEDGVTVVRWDSIIGNHCILTVKFGMYRIFEYIFFTVVVFTKVGLGNCRPLKIIL